MTRFVVLIVGLLVASVGWMYSSEVLTALPAPQVGDRETYDYDAAGNITTDNTYEHNRLTTSTSSNGYTGRW